MGGVVVVGDRIVGHEPQDAIGEAVGHAASALGVDRPEVRWLPTDEVDASALDGASALWIAPGGPYRSLEGALEAIRWARERRIPLVGTCAGFQHGVIEFARNVLGHERAAHAEYEPEGDAELFIDELLCSLVGQTMAVDVVDPHLAAIYGAARVDERYYCRFGLNPAWRQALDDAGLRVAGVDHRDGDVRILRLDGHPFFLLTLFVPQTSSEPGRPHPIVTAFVAAAAGLDGARELTVSPPP